MLGYFTATSTTQSGVTVKNSVIVAPADLWNPNRAMRTTLADGDREQRVSRVPGSIPESGACNHIDGVQLYSGSPGTYGSVTFTGNLCYDDYNCLAGVGRYVEQHDHRQRLLRRCSGAA